MEHRRVTKNGVSERTLILVAVFVFDDNGVNCEVLIPVEFLVILNADNWTQGVAHGRVLLGRSTGDVRCFGVSRQSHETESVVSALFAITISIQELIGLTVFRYRTVNRDGIIHLVEQLIELDAQCIVIFPRQGHLSVVRDGECLFD